MNVKLILQLSGFGLIMAIATVSLIPSHVEPLFWLPILIVSAYLIARNTNRKYFLHGLLVGLANCVWITSAHILFFHTYLANHLQEAAMLTTMPMPNHPRLMMLMTGPVIGILSGCVIGFFAFLASKLIKIKPDSSSK